MLVSAVRSSRRRLGINNDEAGYIIKNGLSLVQAAPMRGVRRLEPPGRNEERPRLRRPPRELRAQDGRHRAESRVGAAARSRPALALSDLAHESRLSERQQHRRRTLLTPRSSSARQSKAVPSVAAPSAHELRTSASAIAAFVRSAPGQELDDGERGYRPRSRRARRPPSMPVQSVDETTATPETPCVSMLSLSLLSAKSAF